MNTPVEGVFNNMHGHWTPPSYVLTFWSSSCVIEWFGEEDYKKKKTEVTESYLGAVNQYYGEYAH